MIQYICDGCGETLAHSGPEIPKGWASITTEVRWQTGKSGCQEWESDSPTLVCGKCRGDEGGNLSLKADQGVRAIVDQRPKEPGK